MTVDDNLESGGGGSVDVGEVLCWCIQRWGFYGIDLLWWMR